MPKPHSSLQLNWPTLLNTHSYCTRSPIFHVKSSSLWSHASRTTTFSLLFLHLIFWCCYFLLPICCCYCKGKKEVFGIAQYIWLWYYIIAQACTINIRSHWKSYLSLSPLSPPYLPLPSRGVQWSWNFVEMILDYICPRFQDQEDGLIRSITKLFPFLLYPNTLFVEKWTRCPMYPQYNHYTVEKKLNIVGTFAWAVD